ncbi:hypothetical protein IWW34DRAFT_349174 [Fusarium oxysporum f. sp. albedinis]|nr:hypothetical protein IWW34DRAFT_349174 [Fusarium oxysporum f. sp. albedinis]
MGLRSTGSEAAVAGITTTNWTKVNSMMQELLRQVQGPDTSSTTDPSESILVITCTVTSVQAKTATKA